MLNRWEHNYYTAELNNMSAMFDNLKILSTQMSKLYFDTFKVKVVC